MDQPGRVMGVPRGRGSLGWGSTTNALGRLPGGRGLRIRAVSSTMVLVTSNVELVGYLKISSKLG